MIADFKSFCKIRFLLIDLELVHLMDSSLIKLSTKPGLKVIFKWDSWLLRTLIFPVDVEELVFLITS